MLVAFDGRLAEEIRPGVFVFQADGGYKSVEDGLHWPEYVNIKEPEDSQIVSRFYKIQGMVHFVPGPEGTHGQGRLEISKPWYVLLKQDQYTADGKWLGSCEPTPHQTETMKKGRLRRSEMEKYITRS